MQRSRKTSVQLDVGSWGDKGGKHCVRVTLLLLQAALPDVSQCSGGTGDWTSKVGRHQVGPWLDCTPSLSCPEQLVCTTISRTSRLHMHASPRDNQHIPPPMATPLPLPPLPLPRTMDCPYTEALPSLKACLLLSERMKKCLSLSGMKLLMVPGDSGKVGACMAAGG